MLAGTPCTQINIWMYYALLPYLLDKMDVTKRNGMGGRTRNYSQTMFDCFLEIASPQKVNCEGDFCDAQILQTFPLDYKTKEAKYLKQVPQFAFPCKVTM